jgi:hypothetical protein
VQFPNNVIIIKTPEALPNNLQFCGEEENQTKEKKHEAYIG